MPMGRSVALYCCAALEVILDLLRVLAVESFQLLVEHTIPLVNIGHFTIVMVSPPSAECRTLFLPAGKKKKEQHTAHGR